MQLSRPPVRQKRPSAADWPLPICPPACRPPTISNPSSTSATLAPPSTPGGIWLAYELYVCEKLTPSACLTVAPCLRDPDSAPSTACAIAGATPGMIYTVAAAACATADCTGVKSAQSALSSVTEFTTPYP